jgi:hypothetical protein
LCARPPLWSSQQQPLKCPTHDDLVRRRPALKSRWFGSSQNLDRLRLSSNSPQGRDRIGSRVVTREGANRTDDWMLVLRMNVATALALFALSLAFGRWHRLLSLGQVFALGAVVGCGAGIAWMAVGGHDVLRGTLTTLALTAAGGLFALLFSGVARHWLPRA